MITLNAQLAPRVVALPGSAGGLGTSRGKAADERASRLARRLPRTPSEQQIANLAQAFADRLTHLASDTHSGDWYEGETWYGKAHDCAAQMGFTYRYSTPVVAAVIAVLSPRKRWSTNIDAAHKMLRARVGMDNDMCSRYPSVHFGPQQRAAERILDCGNNPEFAAEQVRGPKVSSFYRAILGDPNAVTLDAWAARAAGCPEDRLSRKPVRLALYHAYVSTAKVHYISPRDFQAVAWVSQRGTPT